MIEILGRKFLTTKEASKRYGMSEDWFSQRRWKNLPPKYTKICDNGRVLYPKIETDQWFEHQLRMREGA